MFIPFAQKILFKMKNTEFIKRLLKTSSLLSTEKNVKKLLNLIIEELKNYLEADRATLYLLDKEKKELLFFITRKENPSSSTGNLTVIPNTIQNQC